MLTPFSSRHPEALPRTRSPLRPSARVGTLLRVAVILWSATTVLSADTVTRLVLVDATTDQDLFELIDGSVIDLSVTGTALNVRAETDPFPTGSVRFDYDGVVGSQVESTAPYAAFGDSAGDYDPWTPTLGAHSLTATAFTGSGATGTAGPGLSVAFTVQSSGGGVPGLQVLVVSETAGFSHTSQIAAGEAMFEDLALDEGFDLTLTGSSTGFFTTTALADFDVVVFLNTTGDFLNASEQTAFESWIGAGGGFIGIHSATDTEYGWPFYGELVGAWFSDHPPGMQSATLDVVAASHPATGSLPSTFDWTDEWYNFQTNPAGDPDTTVLITIDESTYSGGTMGDPHPISWVREFGGGRTFYTAFGHNSGTYDAPWFREHVLAGLAWVAPVTMPPTDADFIRGDLNEDGTFNLVDALVALGILFGSIPAPGCPDRLDVNDDQTTDVADAVDLLNYLFFAGAPTPAAPFPNCGPDPTPDGLGCAASNCP